MRKTHKNCCIKINLQTNSSQNLIMFLLGGFFFTAPANNYHFPHRGPPSIIGFPLNSSRPFD